MSEKCEKCGGSKRVPNDRGIFGDIRSRKPCPDCQAARIEELEKVCRAANIEIIAALEIPTEKRLETDKDNLMYIILDMRAREIKVQQILKAALGDKPA